MDYYFRHVFGKTLICKDMETAIKLSKQTNLDCVVLSDGVKLTSTGFVEGGYLNKEKSRMKLHENRKNLKQKINDCEIELSEIRNKIISIEDEINKFSQTVQYNKKKETELE